MAELTREQVLTAVISGRGPAYLRGVDLSGLNLSGAGWLREADLRGANLSRANLGKANLTDARLESANLHEVNLTGAILEGANLKDTRLSVAIAKMANFKEANLAGARMVGTVLQKANLEGADLRNADLEGANLEEADLSRARLDNANLKMAKMKGANLMGASLTGTVLEADTVAQGRKAAPGGSAEQRLKPSGFSGSIHKTHLSDLVQVASLSRADLLVRVESEGRQGNIHVRSGRVCHAQAGGLAGEAALFEILNWENGSFETLPSSGEVTVSIEKPLEHLLIESMRHRDERQTTEEKRYDPK
jgi:uncharacterized protein YjbI with pentapeptide repeats